MKNNRGEEKEKETAELQKQFINLQQEWDSYQKSNSNPRAKRRNSTSASNVTVVKNLDQFFDTSPRHLMASLQQTLPPPQGEWKVRTNDIVVEEIRRERRAAIESGKLKGRRLFEEEGGEIEIESEVRSVCFADYDVSKPLFSSSSSSSCSSLSDENVKREVEIEEEMEMVGVEEKRVGEKIESCEGKSRGTAMIMLWLAIASIFFAICIVTGFAGHENDSEPILVPT